VECFLRQFVKRQSPDFVGASIPCIAMLLAGCTAAEPVSSSGDSANIQNYFNTKHNRFSHSTVIWLLKPLLDYQ
jgi:hypothetical protein